MESTDAILTVAEVAAELRCSRAHVYSLINGAVADVSPIPAIAMGRRKVVRRSTLVQWKRANERVAGSGMLPTSLELDAVGRMKGAVHA